MRLSSGVLTTNTEILPGGYLLEVQAPQLARAAQPGQYCMLRCCDSQASDPLLRRPFFVAGVEPEQGGCRFLIYARGRASGWLTRLQAGASLDILGPLGHGWTIRPEVSNLLLIGEEPGLAALLFLAQSAVEREISVTLLQSVRSIERSYPVALLPPEVECQVISDIGESEDFARQAATYLRWADAACCSVAAQRIGVLARVGRRWREKNFAQVALCQPFICASGACLACQIELRHGSRLVCRDGPVFAFTEFSER
jgi:dihydroorotate dehydrogenase electron transfer subunit